MLQAPLVFLKLSWRVGRTSFISPPDASTRGITAAPALARTIRRTSKAASTPDQDLGRASPTRFPRAHPAAAHALRRNARAAQSAHEAAPLSPGAHRSEFAH